MILEIKHVRKKESMEDVLREAANQIIQKKYGSHSPYWVRNQSTSDGRHARCTKDGGQLGHIEVGRENEGVRPAAYLLLDRCRIAGGAGTMEDPYIRELSRARTEEPDEAVELIELPEQSEEETEIPAE